MIMSLYSCLDALILQNVSFLWFQACTLARRNAEVFLKYIHRNNVSMPGVSTHNRATETQVKGQFRTT